MKGNNGSSFHLFLLLFPRGLSEGLVTIRIHLYFLLRNQSSASSHHRLQTDSPKDRIGYNFVTILYTGLGIVRNLLLFLKFFWTLGK